MKRTVSAAFASNHEANQAIQNLIDMGIPRDHISTVMSRETRERFYPEDNTAQGTAWGAGVGAVVGGLVAVGSLGVPGGLFVAGPLAALAGGAATGAVGGGLLGALVGAGIPEERARTYEERISGGDVVLAVETATQVEAATAEKAMLKAGGPLPRETLVVSETRA